MYPRKFGKSFCLHAGKKKKKKKKKVIIDNIYSGHIL